MKRTLKEIAEQHPALVFDNNGYEYIRKANLSEADKLAIDEVSNILRAKIEGFYRFDNFKPREGGTLDVRCQHAWDNRFIGVGYFPVSELDKDETAPNAKEIDA